MFTLQHFRVKSQDSNVPHQRDVLRDHSVNRRTKVQTMRFFLRTKIRGKGGSLIISYFLMLGFELVQTAMKFFFNFSHYQHLLNFYVKKIFYFFIF